MCHSKDLHETQRQLQLLETENSQLREALRQKQEKLDQLQEKAKVHIELFELAVDAIISGNNQGRIIGANQSALELTGYPREELLGAGISLLFSEAEQKRVPLRYDLLQKGEIVMAERLLNRKDGTLVPIEMNSKMMPDGTYHTFIRDISSRKEMEEMLRDSELKQRALANATFEAIFLSSNGICIGQNENAARMFGYTESEAIGKPGTNWIIPEEHDKVREKAATGYELPYETIALRKDGTTFPAEVQGRTIPYEGGDIRVIALRDITSRKKAEKDKQMLRRLESLGTLAGGIAHDFNNILTGVFGSISLAKLQLSKEHKAYSFVEQAENSITRATLLTQKLLTFAKGGEPLREMVSLGQLVSETVSFDLSGSNVKVVLDEQDDLLMADVDKGQIQQVFSNLAINAAQAMPRGGNLQIILENYHNNNQEIEELQRGPYIKATVCDDGEGIGQEDIGRIFDPYYTTKSTGSGLGLASVYSIVKKHKGFITAASSRGEGTTFTLYLPAILGADKQQASAKEVEKAEKAALGGRVLIMDDDAAIRLVLQELLVQMDCEVVATEDGLAASAQYRQYKEAGKPFDLVILDLTVPGGGGGQETVQRILEYDPQARVIVSSGYAEDSVIANYSEFGFKAVVTKPYTYDQLLRTISKVLAGMEK